jgi:uncharacterized membrane protein YeaQ/YmgE (transglycosylase-associated protein family)
VDPILWYLAVGLIAGWLTGKVMKGAGYGPLLDIVLGIAGAFIGARIMTALGFAGSGGIAYTIGVAVVGAVCLVALMRLLLSRRRATL